MSPEIDYDNLNEGDYVLICVSAETLTGVPLSSQSFVVPINLLDSPKNEVVSQNKFSLDLVKIGMSVYHTAAKKLGRVLS